MSGHLDFYPHFCPQGRGGGIAFRQAIRGKDAILFVTPEYNRAMPGVLKKCHRRGFDADTRDFLGGFLRNYMARYADWIEILLR